MKTEEVKRLVMEGKLMEALLIAGKFKREFGLTKEELKAIQLGYSCIGNEDFYKQLGLDTEEKIKIACDILARVYGTKAKTEREEQIINQFKTFTEYFNNGTITMDALYNIFNLRSAEDKNILLNYINELKERKIIEPVMFGIYINEEVL